MKRKKLSDFRQQVHNANRHTERGMAMLEDSMRDVGYTAPMIAAADGEIISGSARHEKAAEVFGSEAEPLVVETDGNRPVVRKDVPNAKDKRARRIALAENRVAEVNLDWDENILAQLQQTDGLLDSLFTGRELAQLIGDNGDGSDAEPQIDKAKELQREWKTKRGQLWRIGDHWYAFKKGANHRWFGERDKTTVWEIDKVSSIEYQHPMQKPVGLFVIPMQNHMRDGELCFEPFSGSGSQLVAAQNLNRRCFACEISPEYVAVALQRMSDAFSGIKITCDDL